VSNEQIMTQHSLSVKDGSEVEINV